MDQERKNKPEHISGRQVAILVSGVLIFGLLMALRADMHSVWLRILCAGCAGAVLGLSLVYLKKRNT
jgi:hypothetical protein